MDFAACPDDDMFGPAVRGCRGDFDFTLKFEKIFFDIIPASVFIAGALTRILYLYTRAPVLVGGNWFRYLKLVSDDLVKAGDKIIETYCTTQADAF